MASFARAIEDLKRLVHGIIALGGRDIVNKARELAQLETMLYETEEIEQEEMKRNWRQTVRNKRNAFERTARGIQTNH